VRVPHAADWIERTTCALSSEAGELSFCPQLVCPADARLLGYPSALLPNGAGAVAGNRGFAPVRVTQRQPPPGTELFSGTTTHVTMSAVDAAGRELECVWRVQVEPSKGRREMDWDPPRGTYTTRIRFRRNSAAISRRFLPSTTSQSYRGRGTSRSKSRPRLNGVGHGRGKKVGD
jgi:hypothetical protein